MQTVWGVVMDSSDLRAAMVVLQVVIGLSIVAGSVIPPRGCDRRSRCSSCPGRGAGAVGAWFAWIGWQGLHDSPPALAMGACVAFVVLPTGARFAASWMASLWPPRSVNPSSSSGRGR